jgi:hypothetical protein
LSLMFFQVWCFWSNSLGYGFYKPTRVGIGFFRLLFFSDFITRHWFFFYKIGFMVFFVFPSIRLSQSHNLIRGFCRLTRVGHTFFFVLITLSSFRSFCVVEFVFKKFVFQYLVCWELSFVVFLYLVFSVK